MSLSVERERALKDESTRQENKHPLEKVSKPDSESEDELWALVDSTRPQLNEKLAPPINNKLSRWLLTMWDVTVPYAQKKQQHKEYSQRPSNMHYFVVPQTLKQLNDKLSKSNCKDDERIMHCTVGMLQGFLCVLNRGSFLVEFN